MVHRVGKSCRFIGFVDRWLGDNGFRASIWKTKVMREMAASRLLVIRINGVAIVCVRELRCLEQPICVGFAFGTHLQYLRDKIKR